MKHNVLLGGLSVVFGLLVIDNIFVNYFKYKSYKEVCGTIKECNKKHHNKKSK